MDTVETFKNKAQQNYAGASNRRKKRNADGTVTELDERTSKVIDTIESNPFKEYSKKMAEQTKTQPSEDVTSKALASSRRQNIQQDTSNGQALNNQIAALESAKAQEIAAQQAQAKALEATKNANNNAQQQFTQRAINDEGWKKYYDEEKKKVRDQSFKDNWLNSTLQDMFNAGWDRRLAETNARNRYASELNQKAYDDNGNILDANAAQLLSELSSYNSALAKQKAEQEHATGKAYGATYDSDFKDPRLAVSNAIANMDVGNAMLGGAEGDAADAGRFLLNLLPGMAKSPIDARRNLGEAFAGKGLDRETGDLRDLTDSERWGRGISGAIDAAGVMFGGSEKILEGVSKAFAKGAGKQVIKNASKGAVKEFFKDMAKEGLEEGVQQAAEFFGDGGSLVTDDGEFDQESFKELMSEVGQASSLGALGGGLMNLGGRAIGSGISKIKGGKNNVELESNVTNKTNAGKANTVEDINTQANVNLNENVNTETNVNEDVNTNENVDTKAEKVKVDGTRNIINDLLNTVKKTNAIDANTKTDINDRVQKIRDSYNNGEITIDEANSAINDLKNNVETVTAESMADVQEESATGQPMNPSETTAVEDAQGTQAADGVPTENNEVNTSRNTVEEVEGMQPGNDLGQTNYEENLSRFEQELDEMGMTQDIQKKIQAANATAQNGKVDLSSLNKKEQAVYRAVLQKLADAGILQGTVDENFNKGWLPQRTANTDYLGNGIEEFFNTGDLENVSLKHRSGYVATSGNMDFSNKPLADLLARAALGDKAYVDAVVDVAQDSGVSINTEQAAVAAGKAKEAVESINNAGDEKGTLKQQEVKAIKSRQQLNESGKAMGIPQQINAAKASGFSMYEKLQSLGQWWNGYCFGVKENINTFAQMNKNDVISMIRDGFENVGKNKKEAIISQYDSIYKQNLQETGDAGLAEKLTNKTLLNKIWYKNAINTSFKTDFTNPKSAQVIDEAFADYMVRNRVQQTAMQKVASGISRCMNSSFRGLRWQTTLNEIPEIFKNLTDFGKINLVVSPAKIDAIKSKYGFTDGSLADQYKATLDPAKAQALEQALLEAGGDVKKQTNIIMNFLKTADEKTQWNGFIQNIKDATYLQAAENYYRSKGGMSEAQIRQAVLNDYAARMLPMDRVYKYITSDSAMKKPLLMYLDSSLRLTAQNAKAAVGLNTAGRNAEINSKFLRAARNLEDLGPRLVSAMVMGVPIEAVLGLFTVGGDDYSGIDDEDKNLLDRIIGVADDFSPLISIISKGYYTMRQDEIAEEKGYNPEDIRGDVGTRIRNDALKSITPLGNQLDSLFGLFGNQNNSLAVNTRGYGVNSNDRVTYLKDTNNPIDMLMGILAGENKTSGAREYNNNPDLISALINQTRDNDFNGDGNADGGIMDFFRENAAVDSLFGNPITDALGLNAPKPEEEYNRPASESDTSNYNKMIQESTGEEREMWYQKSREYNAIKDNLRISNPTAVEVYNTSLGNDIISPQKWSIIAYANGQDADNHLVNLDTWNMMKEMAIKRSQDFNTLLNPQWLLDDEHASEYLQYKSTATGEDTALSRIMKIDPFWQDFFAKQREFYNNQGESDWDDSKATENVKRWNALNDEMSAMYDWDTNMNLRQTYPVMAEYNSLKKALQSKYGDDFKSSQEYKTFWSTYGDAYNAENEKYNTAMLLIVNQMRSIEGFPPLTADQWDAIGDIGYSSSKSGGGGGGSDYSYAPEFRNSFNTDPYYMSAQADNPSGFGWKKAKKANFYDVPTSSSSGQNPYAAV